MEIKKDTIVLVLNRTLIPFDRRVCLVTEVCEDGFEIVDWEGGETELPESELLFLAQSKVETRNVKEALASCYEEVVQTLAAICDVVPRES